MKIVIFIISHKTKETLYISSSISFIYDIIEIIYCTTFISFILHSYSNLNFLVYCRVAHVRKSLPLESLRELAEEIGLQPEVRTIFDAKSTFLPSMKDFYLFCFFYFLRCFLFSFLLISSL